MGSGYAADDMRTTLVSDVHVRDLDDPHQDEIVHLFDTWETDAWVLLGDVFDTWWGWRRAVFVEAVPLLAAIHRAKRRGVTVMWVPGNRDARPGGAVADGLGVEVRPRWRGRAGASEVLAVHGDVGGGPGQRIVDRVVRGRLADAVVGLAGPDRAWRVIRALGDASHSANDLVDPGLLAAQAEWADRELGRGVDVVCVGHSHAPGVDLRPGGRLVNLGDWVYHRTFAVVDDDVRLLRWADGEVRPVDGPPARREPVR
jgi:UDP-2,3-diacylglucosamine hydrolase